MPLVRDVGRCVCVCVCALDGGASAVSWSKEKGRELDRAVTQSKSNHSGGTERVARGPGSFKSHMEAAAGGRLPRV